MPCAQIICECGFDLFNQEKCDEQKQICTIRVLNIAKNKVALCAQSLIVQAWRQLGHAFLALFLSHSAMLSL